MDENDRVFVRPADGDFEHVFRAAMGVYWYEERKVLSHPDPPREWTHLQWFRQILGAVRDEYGIDLEVTDQTIWTNVPVEMKAAICRD